MPSKKRFRAETGIGWVRERKAAEATVLPEPFTVTCVACGESAVIMLGDDWFARHECPADSDTRKR